MATPDLLWKVAEKANIKLKEYDPAYTDKHTNQASTVDELVQLGQQLSDLQELLFAAQQHSVLIILQGMDTSGKDGTVQHVFEHVNPQGCDVHSFKTPTTEELAHDFLWRVHKVTPQKGELGIFNRSHYEDILVVRVHNLVSEDVWSRRYKEINHFEKLLTHNNTIILKFFLHISPDEQERRLLAREHDKDKAWKISSGDFVERKYWNAYQDAYEDVLNKCSTNYAPWYIVPSDHKWYRNLAIAHTLVHTLRKHQDQWRAHLEERGKKELALLQQMRASKQI